MAHSYPPLVEGNAASSVRVITFEDLQCKDCSWLRRKMDEQIVPAYGDRVAFEHREYPLTRHEWARSASLVARHFVSVSHGLAVAFRRDVMADMSIISVESFPQWVREFAADYGADAEEAIASLHDPDVAASIEADIQEGRARNVIKTPTVFVNGAVFVEWVPIDKLSAAIESALEQNR